MAPRGGQDNAQGSVWEILVACPKPGEELLISGSLLSGSAFFKKGPKVKAQRYPKDPFAKNNYQGQVLEGKVGFPKHFVKK